MLYLQIGREVKFTQILLSCCLSVKGLSSCVQSGPEPFLAATTERVRTDL